MLKGIRPTFRFLLSTALLASALPLAGAAAATRQTETKNPIADLPIFDPAPAREALPDLAKFDAWTNSDSGKTLIGELLQDEQTRWLGLFRQLDTRDPDPDQLAQISPVIQQINADPARRARLQQNIERLSNGSLAADQQSVVLAEVVRDFRDAREEVADKAIKQLRDFKDGFAARIKKLGLKQEDVAREVDTVKRRMIDPIAYLYGTTPQRAKALSDLSRYLTNFKVSYMADALDQGRETAEEPDFAVSPTVTFLATEAPKPKSATEQSSRILRPSAAELRRFGTPTLIDSGARTGDINRIVLGSKSDPNAIKTDPMVFPFFPGAQGPAAATDVVALLEAGNLASDVTYISMYEQGLDQDVDSIISQARKGKKFIIVADFSQLFPEKVARVNQRLFPNSRDNARPVKPRRPQYQKLVDAFLAQNPTDNNWRDLNIQLYALKGKGSIGINHNKFRIWSFPDGRKVLQVGSFNYTPRSQFNHWENVMFFDDSTPEGKQIVEIFELYHRWQIAGGGAVRFSEDLEAEDPDITSPLWHQTAFTQKYRDTDFANVSFSPAATDDPGSSYAWVEKLINLSNQDVYFAMFGFYPPQEMMDALKGFMTRARKESQADGPVLRVLTDYSQSHNSASMAALKLIMAWKDAEVRVLSGPNETDPSQHHELGEVMHNKLARGRYLDPETAKKIMKDIAAREQATQMVIAGGSTNTSKNAWYKSFENMIWMVLDQYQRTYTMYAQPLSEYMDALWDLGRIPKFDRRRPRNEFGANVGGAGDDQPPQ